MQAERFDQITRTLSLKLFDSPNRNAGFWGDLGMFFRAVLRSLAPPRDESGSWPAGQSIDLLTTERLRFVKSRTVADIPVTTINPRKFLADLTSYSRNEFLSLMTEAQQKQFMSLTDSAQFFNLLTPDQRATLAVKFVPQFSNLVNSSASGAMRAPRTGPVVPYTAVNGFNYPKRNAPSWLSPPPLINSPVAHIQACYLAGLSWTTCYFSYQATLSIDRDGTPCTYGPFPCASGSPPNPPGKTYESPFCPGADADNYGCGALANEFANVASCPGHPNAKGVPLELLCNATDNNGCTYASISPALFKSVVTNEIIPNCVIDSYKDPVTGDLIQVPIKTDAAGYTPCVQQSAPGACGGIDCPCPGLYISQTSMRAPNWASAPMNPNNYLNALLIPYVSVSLPAYKNCKVAPGMFVVASVKFDAQTNPTEDPADWVGGVLADVGTLNLGEVSYAMWDALGISPSDNPSVTFRIYPQVQLSWPVDRPTLDSLKAKYLGVCCPGDIDDQCHAHENRGKCNTDPQSPGVSTCECTGGWLPDLNGDCTWSCPGSDQTTWVGSSTDSGYEECNGNGRCIYGSPNADGDTIGACLCDDGWFGFAAGSCTFRDCVMPTDWLNLYVPPCYGHGTCHNGSTITDPGTCVCDDGWSNGPNGDQYCSQQACSKDCSGHGTCIVTGPFGPAPFCSCDIEHGWYGEDCSQQGCITQDGTICSGVGSCQLDKDGNAVCSCPAEWGGGTQYGPMACGTRECAGCPPGVASCTNDWNWIEIFCLCICGNNCKHSWKCHCNDSTLQPPDCSTKKCCSGYFGECNSGLQARGVLGGGACPEAGGTCVCYDNYDPSQCCGVPLPGAAAPPGFGQPCRGASAKTINLVCSGTAGPCGSCGLTQLGYHWVLQPDGGGNFHDDLANKYKLDETTCKVSLVSYGPNTNGAQCGKAPDPAFWLSINGNTGTGVEGLICLTDCNDCHETIPCSLTLT
jgi:hypothetical protein